MKWTSRGLRLQSSSWCAQLSWAPTPMPHPTPVRTSGVSLGSRLPTLHFPSHSSQVSRVHYEGLKRNAVGGVLLNAPSPLWGSPVFLQGRVRLTWSPIAQGKTMAEPQETQQEKETRWAAQRAAHETQQKDYRAARARTKGRNWLVVGAIVIIVAVIAGAILL